MRRPRHKRHVALAALLAAVALALAALPFRARWWGALLLAVGEAGVVGGLADWFAVTALFRHPLGLPIPHTALIPANWQLLAERVGSMVGGRVLTAAYVTEEIARVDVAALLRRGAERIGRADIDAVVGPVARWAAEQLPRGSTTELIGWLRRVLATRPVAPLLADVLDAARRQGWDQRAIEAVARLLADLLDRPDLRDAIGDLVDGVVGGYRQRMGLYPSFLIKLADLVGLIDRSRLVSALRAAFLKVADDPDDPLRGRLVESIAALAEQLRTDARLAARVEAAWADVLASPEVSRLLDDAAAGLRRALVDDLGGERSELVAWLTGELDRARRTLMDDRAVRETLDGWLKGQATRLVERYHGRVASFIERGVRALGPEGAVRLIEEHAGDDLQYIRVNGTVVGGIAGGAIHGLHRLLGLCLPGLC